MKRRTMTIPILLMALMAVCFQPSPQAIGPQAAPAATAATQKPAPAATTPAPAATPGAPRAMELGDILAWKSVGTALISSDGRWFAYRVSPLDGDSDVVVRQTQGDKEYKFPVGEGRAGQLAFSEDGKWVAFNVAPTKKEAAQLRKQRRPIQSKVTILNLADGTETKIDKISRFAFSGEKSAWIALKKYGADAPGGGSAPPAAPPAAGSAAAAAADERPKGTDLVLRELATGSEQNIGNVNEFAFDKVGNLLAYTVDASDKLGNGIVLQNLTAGTVLPLDTGKASYERLSWTEKGDGLTVLKSLEDKRYKDKVYAALGFTKFGAGRPEKTVYDPSSDKTFPDGVGISPNRTPAWTEDLSAITFGIRKPKKSDAKPEPAKGDEKADAKAEAKPAAEPGADSRR
jgi:hypothetical protein